MPKVDWISTEFFLSPQSQKSCHPHNNTHSKTTKSLITLSKFISFPKYKDIRIIIANMVPCKDNNICKLNKLSFKCSA